MTDVCNAVVRDGKIPEELEQELDGECIQRKG